MKKKDFITLVMSTVGGILFALGMCMALIPEWAAMTQGIVIGAIGAVVFGVGMCMTMVWNILVPGVIVGLVGIVLLLCLIPVIKGLK